jgi:hypothetical protein
MPTADLQSIFGGSFINTLALAQQILATKKFQIRSDVTIIFQGIALPQQSITNEVTI